MKKTLLTLVMILGLGLVSAAQTLTLEDCVAKARGHYPAVAQYGLIERTAQFSLSNASKAWLPQGTLSAQITWQNDVAALPDALTDMMAHQGLSYPGLEKTQYKIGLDVSQQIWDGGKTSANRRSIRAASEVEARSLDVRMYDVEGKVQDIYFSIVLLDEKIVRAGKSITLVDSTLRQVRSMFANGVAMQSDCDQMEAQLLGLQQQKVQLQATLDSYRSILEIFIGEPVAGRTLALPSEDSVIASACSQSRLRLFDSQLGSVSSQEAAIRASAMPAIGAFLSGYYGYPGYDMFGNMQNRNLSLNFMVGLKASWNFGALYTRKSNLAKLGLERDRIETDRSVFLFNNSIAENESVGRISSLREVMRNDRRIVSLRQSVLNAAQSQLRNGVIDATALLSKITDVQLAENDLSLHRIQLIQALYNLNHIRNK